MFVVYESCNEVIVTTQKKDDKFSVLNFDCGIRDRKDYDRFEMPEDDLAVYISIKMKVA